VGICGILWGFLYTGGKKWLIYNGVASVRQQCGDAGN
jgi:hypothetical protein